MNLDLDVVYVIFKLKVKMFFLVEIIGFCVFLMFILIKFGLFFK